MKRAGPAVKIEWIYTKRVGKLTVAVGRNSFLAYNY